MATKKNPTQAIFSKIMPHGCLWPGDPECPYCTGEPWPPEDPARDAEAEEFTRQLGEKLKTENMIWHSMRDLDRASRLNRPI